MAVWVQSAGTAIWCQCDAPTQAFVFDVQVALKGKKCFDKPISFLAVAFSDEKDKAVCAHNKCASYKHQHISLPSCLYCSCSMSLRRCHEVYCHCTRPTAFGMHYPVPAAPWRTTVSN
jgi:hypothetical protein